MDVGARGVDLDAPPIQPGMERPERQLGGVDGQLSALRIELQGRPHARHGPGPPVARLVLPRWLAARNALRVGGARPYVLAALTALFWAGCFAFFVRVLEYFQTIGEFGPLLTQRLLVLLLVTFFAVLLLSKTVTALTTFYLAGDVPLLLGSLECSANGGYFPFYLRPDD